nr:4315_t:CDS:2 [Entrophospora candida]
MCPSDWFAYIKRDSDEEHPKPFTEDNNSTSLFILFSNSLRTLVFYRMCNKVYNEIKIFQIIRAVEPNPEEVEMMVISDKEALIV